jgi:dephospho-CoA kinase
MGSGKTTCTKLLSGLGGCEINADHEAKQLMMHSPTIQNALAEEFGSDIIRDDELLFPVLGSRAFESLETIKKLNSIIHPDLIDHLKQCIDCRKEDVVILDAALIPLWNIESWFDFRIWIDADFQTRLNRLLQTRAIHENSQDVFSRRMHIQEELFSPPSTESWIYIKNEYTENDLIASIIEWIRTVPLLAQSLYIESHF